MKQMGGGNRSRVPDLGWKTIIMCHVSFFFPATALTYQSKSWLRTSAASVSGRRSLPKAVAPKVSQTVGPIILHTRTSAHADVDVLSSVCFDLYLYPFAHMLVGLLAANWLYNSFLLGPPASHWCSGNDVFVTS